MSFTKQALIDTVMRQCNLSKSEATKSMETLLEIIKKSLSPAKMFLPVALASFVSKKRRLAEVGILRRAEI